MTESLNVQEIIKDFPILNQKVNGKRLAYLDTTATSQTPIQVINVLEDYYKRYNSNVHRGVHTLGSLATDAYESARESVRRFINAQYFEEIIFTRGTTASINLVARSYGDANLTEGDEIVVTEMEHHANIVPWQQLAKRTKAELKFIPMTPDGELDIEDVKATINDKTKIVAIAHVSNVLGTINDVKAIAEVAHQHGAIISVDGAQSAPHLALDMQDLDVDFFSFSGHKMLGPTGIGVLYAKEEYLEKMKPIEYGGGMNQYFEVTGEVEYKSIPTRFEAGTPPIAEVIGLGAAIDYLQNIGMDKIYEHEKELKKYLVSKLENNPKVILYNKNSGKPCYD